MGTQHGDVVVDEEFRKPLSQVPLHHAQLAVRGPAELEGQARDDLECHGVPPTEGVNGQRDVGQPLRLASVHVVPHLGGHSPVHCEAVVLGTALQGGGLESVGGCEI